jgi:multiple antibiotic resistance protein
MILLQNSVPTAITLTDILNIREIISVSLILFSVIDILGSIPIIVDLRKKTGEIKSGTATLVAGGLMVSFLYLGESFLRLFGLDVASFAVAGAIILFLIGLEMMLGITFFKGEEEARSSSIVPLAFPLLAGAGTMTTIISLRAEYNEINILIGIFLNLILVYIVLKSSGWIEKMLGQTGTNVLRKVFGVILLAIAVKLFKTNFSM